MSARLPKLTPDQLLSTDTSSGRSMDQDSPKSPSTDESSEKPMSSASAQSLPTSLTAGVDPTLSAYAQAAGVAWASYDILLSLLKRMKPQPFTADAYLLEEAIHQLETDRKLFLSLKPGGQPIPPTEKDEVKSSEWGIL